MTEEQKKFKILKKESYEQQISEKDKQITSSTFSAGILAAGAILLLPNVIQSPTLLHQISFMVLGLINAGYSIKYVRILIELICQKTMLQGKVEDIYNELEMLEMEEKRGRSIW